MKLLEMSNSNVLIRIRNWKIKVSYQLQFEIVASHFKNAQRSLMRDIIAANPSKTHKSNKTKQKYLRKLTHT